MDLKPPPNGTRTFIVEGRRYRVLTCEQMEYYQYWRGDAQVVVREPCKVNGEWCYDEGPAT